MEKIKMILALGLITAILVMAGSASAAQTDSNINTDEITVEQRILQMQQEIIKKNFATRLLKNQMRTKMMPERVSKKIMQNSIQPVITEQVRAIFKEQQMKALMIR
ncbi:MAG: hypothetical protein D3908_11075 [Candidatus Electrothrix sp. AUS4]|nr:hypothetical protein [Candidatus Electrothrix sp. AUS4]